MILAALMTICRLVDVRVVAQSIGGCSAFDTPASDRER